jgi:hypothetical protein
MAHPVVWLELTVEDDVKDPDFYPKALGWTIERDEPARYTMFAAEGGPGGGFNTTDMEDISTGNLIVYIETDDIDATLAKIEANGGKVVKPKKEIPSVGWFAYFTDPTGNRLATIQWMPREE